MPAPYTLELHPVVGIVNEVTTTPSELLVLTLLPVLKGTDALDYTAGVGIVITGLNLAVDTTVIATREYAESVSDSALAAATTFATSADTALLAVANTYSDIANAATLASANATTALVQDLAETNAFKIDQLQNDLDTTNQTAASNYTALDTAKADKTTVTTLQTLVDTKATPADITAAIAVLVDGAPDALNTLNEIATALQGDEATITTILTALNNRVRFDAAQSLTTPQQDQARSNIDAEKAGVASTLVAAVTPASIGAATAAQGAKADTALQSGDVSPVALSGSFSDLINKSALFNLAYSAYAIGSNVAIAATDTLGQMLGKLQAQVNTNVTAIGTKEPTITGGTVAQFWAGTKTFRDLATDVRATVLTGLSTATGAAITATDTVLGALGSLQNQVSANTSSLTNKVDKVTGKGLSTEDYTTAEKTKLSGVATGATANQSDSYLLNRTNHTGSQASSTITNFVTDGLTNLHKSSAISSASNVLTLDLSLAQEVRLLTLTENITTWTPTNLPAVGFIAEVSVVIKQSASTAYTVANPASGKVTGGFIVNSSALGVSEIWTLWYDSTGVVAMTQSGVLA